MRKSVLEKHKKIALVAHDNQKNEMIKWALVNKKALSKHHLHATGTTGKLLEEALDLKVTKFMSGPLGGDQQLGAAIAEGNLDILIFFWDPMAAQPHEPDIRALLRLGQVYNIPIATNYSTADFLISSPLMNEEYEVSTVDYTRYVNRKV